LKPCKYCFLSDSLSGAGPIVGNTMEITIGGKTVFITVGTQKKVEIYSFPSKVPYKVSMYGVNSAGSGPAT
jgi:hypothetical protein